MFKASLLSLIIVSSAIQTYSQDGAFHFNEDFEPTDKDNSNYYRLIYMQDGGLFLILDFFKSGDKYAVGYAKSSNIPWHYRKEARYKLFYQNGKVKQSQNYMEGSPIGTSVLYFNDGTVYKKVRYSNTDLRVMEVYSQSGENLVMNGNGPSREYDSEQDIIESGKYVNGLKQGPWIAERASGQKYYTENYDKGKLTTGLSYNVEGDEFVYSKILDAPTFKGGSKKMYKYVNRNIHYPITAQKARISGKVITVFEIMSDGSIGRTYLLPKKVQDDVDKEAIDIINKMSGKWVPGKVRGQFQKVSFTLPITFELPTNQRIETFGKSQTPKAMQF